MPEGKSHNNKIQKIIKEYQQLDLPVVTENIVEDITMISMRDNCRLKTHVFHMENKNGGWSGKSYPVILQRSPYLHAEEIYRTHGIELAKRGFVYILQWCRGIGESEGEWNPNENEREDGLDTLDYFVSCAWVKNIGFWGDSYLALTGWCMADAVPDKVKGMYLGVYGTDRFCSVYEKGLFRHDVFTAWAMENAGEPIEADYLESCFYRPHYMVDEKLWGIKLPWYRKMISAVCGEDAYWQTGVWKLLREIPEKVKIPLFIREGWYDHHLGSAIKTYERLGKEAKEHSTFQIGCWNHESEDVLEWTDALNLQQSEVQTMVPWFQKILMDDKVPDSEISLYVIGEDQWIKKKKWPLEVEVKKKWFLAENYALTENANSKAQKYTYYYNPDKPVYSYGTESMFHDMSKVGSLYQPALNYREDVLSFVSLPLKESITIGGKIKVYLTVSTDCEDTSFTAKLMVEKGNGKFVNIRSSITTISAMCRNNDYIPENKLMVCIDMWDIVWKINEGERLRLDVSSSDFPQYTAHTNYAGVWSKQEKCRIAQQTIYAGMEYSWVEIPIIS